MRKLNLLQSYDVVLNIPNKSQTFFKKTSFFTILILVILSLALAPVLVCRTHRALMVAVWIVVAVVL